MLFVSVIAGFFAFARNFPPLRSGFSLFLFNFARPFANGFEGVNISY
jgi:hypothetical protein